MKLKINGRCEWPGEEDKLMVKYHDEEWGNPCHDDKKLFEYLILDTFQAGLSWRTILHKRENFRKTFHGFHAVKIAKYTKKDIKRLMNEAGIIRNRLKILSVVNNAKKFLELQKEFGSFSNYLWRFTNEKQIKNNFKNMGDIPSKTNISDAISKDLKSRGFSFVGTTIIYAFMQAVGIVNDHVSDCFKKGK